MQQTMRSVTSIAVIAMMTRLVGGIMGGTPMLQTVSEGHIRSNGRTYGPFGSRAEMVQWAEANPGIAREIIERSSLTAPAYLFFGEPIPPLYHVTSTEVIPRIEREGLRPLRKARLFAEALRRIEGAITPPGVYLTADPSVIGFVVDYSALELGVEGPFSVVVVRLPGGWPLRVDSAYGGSASTFFSADIPAREVVPSLISFRRIPTENIDQIMDYDLWLSQVF